MGQWRHIAAWATLCAVLAGRALLSQTTVASTVLARERGGLAAPASPAADNVVAQPAATLEAALQAALASAGVAFAGEVLSIDRAGGSVIVRWRVEDAVRGVGAGAIYEQKEWAGLWADGNPRYRVGQRALVLLHAPSVAGYASPVGDGVIPLSGSTVTGTLDLRWLAQQVAVADAARQRPMMALKAAGGDFALSDALLARSAKTVAAASAQRLPRLPSPDESASGGNTVQGASTAITTPGEDANAHADGAMILGMLHAWQRAGTAGQ